jgi:hypothetical protein
MQQLSSPLRDTAKPVTIEEEQWFMDGEFKNPTFKLV